MKSDNTLLFLGILLVVVVILAIYLNSSMEHFGFWKEMKCNMNGCGPIKCKLKDPVCDGCGTCKLYAHKKL